MDPREDPNDMPADGAGQYMRERLRDSIARQAEAIRRAAAQRVYKGGLEWPDRRETDAAFVSLAQAWEREASLPQRGWERDLPDPSPESFGLGVEEPALNPRDARKVPPRHARALKAISILAGLAERRAHWGESAEAADVGTGQPISGGAKQAVDKPRAAADQVDRQPGHATGGTQTIFDPIGDFAARILEELLDKDGGPRRDRGRRS